MSTLYSIHYERNITYSTSRRIARREMLREKIESWNIRDRIRSFCHMINKKIKKPFEIKNNVHQEGIDNYES